MSNSGTGVKNDEIREIAASALTTSYQNLGGVFTRDAFRIWLTNNTNGDIYLTTDGSTNMMKLPAGGVRASDEKTNDLRRLAGTQFQIKFDVVPGTPTGWFGLEVEYS